MAEKLVDYANTTNVEPLIREMKSWVRRECCLVNLQDLSMDAAFSVFYGQQ